MGFVLSLLLIIVSLLVLGADVHMILTIMLGLLGLLILLTFLFFTFSAISLLASKKTTAVFSRIEKSPMGKCECAYYLVDGSEIPNAFPAEVAFHDALYHENEEITVHLTHSKKYVYDKNAFITILAGFLIFVIIMAVTVIVAMALI